MRNLKIVIPALILAAGFLFSSTASYGKADYAKATKKACVYCHVDPQKAPKELKEPGKYYEQHKTLDGYKEAR